jgi:hypothetical protein
MRFWSWRKQDVVDGLRRTYQRDLRWSYLVIGGMVLVAGFVNAIMPHGWTVWPMVLGAAIMMTMHETAERSHEGVPPFQAYALFAAGLFAWLVVVVLLSAVNPFILLLGLAAIGYQVAHGVIKNRAKRALVDQRKADGRCIYCGEPANYDLAYCANCGEDPDPERTRMDRVASMAQQESRGARIRAALNPESHAASAKRREQTLLARSRSKPRRQK